MKRNIAIACIACVGLFSVTGASAQADPLSWILNLFVFKLADKVASRLSDTTDKAIDEGFDSANSAASLDGCTPGELEATRQAATFMAMNAPPPGMMTATVSSKCTPQQTTGLMQTALPNPLLPPGMVPQQAMFPTQYGAPQLYGANPAGINNGYQTVQYPGAGYYSGSPGYGYGAYPQYGTTGYNPYQNPYQVQNPYQQYQTPGYGNFYPAFGASTPFTPPAGWYGYQQPGVNPGLGYSNPQYGSPPNNQYGTQYPTYGSPGYTNSYPTYGAAPVNSSTPATVGGIIFSDDLASDNDGATPAKYDITGAAQVSNGSSGKQINTASSAILFPKIISGTMPDGFALEMNGFLAQPAYQMNFVVVDKNGTIQKILTNGAGYSQYGSIAGAALSGFNQPPVWQHYVLAKRGAALVLFAGQSQMLVTNAANIQMGRIGIEIVCANPCQGVAIKNIKITQVN